MTNNLIYDVTLPAANPQQAAAAAMRFENAARMAIRAGDHVQYAVLSQAVRDQWQAYRANLIAWQKEKRKIVLDTDTNLV